jgi:hypothetical protein
MLIKNWSLKEFARHALVYWPQECKDHELPTRGCMPAVKAWLEDTGIGIPGFLAKLKTADGDQALALYRCAAQGWIPGDQAVELIKTAPGDRALALYECAYRGWIPRAEAVELIKTAPGDRALALYACANRGWIPKAEAVELIKSAPGNRAMALDECANSGWITKAEVETYLETQC